jgi:ABC-type glycerol-3-phosphate transport system permease component
MNFELAGPGRNLLFIIVLTGLLVPSETTIVQLFQLFKSAGMINTHFAHSGLK